MRNAIVSIVLTAASRLIAPSKALFNQSRPNKSLETRCAAYSGIVIIRFSIALLLAFTIGTSLFAQSIGGGESQIRTAQSTEASAAVLQSAEKTGSLVDATIEVPIPLSAAALDYVTLLGQIQSILVTSATSDWKGGIYSTPSTPITSLAGGLRQYEQLYRDAVPGDRNPVFIMTAFTIRGSASEISSARDSLPSANFVSVTEVSKSVGIENAGPTKEGATNEMSMPATSDSLTVGAAATSSAFVPSNAQLNIQTLSNSERQIEVTFSWNSAQDLAGLSGDKAALEIQVLFWNHAADPKKNNVTYVGAIKSWGTDSIAHAYFDTPAANGIGIAGRPEEREVTIGSYNARSDFQANRQYKVWAITEKGALDANFAKLSFQRGIYKPNILQDFAVYNYCQLKGGSDPASCVSGEETFKATPVNHTGSNFSIVAPAIPSFAYPTQTCPIPPGYPYLGEGVRPASLTEQTARDHVSRILAFQKSFTSNGGKPGVGCPTNFVHQDTAWWPNGGRVQDFDGSNGKGAIMLSPNAAQAFWIHGGIWTRYSSTQFRGPQSVVGEPTGNEQSVTSSRGTKGAYQAFTRGWLYFNGTKNQTFYVVNAIAQKYQSVGLHTDQLGFPTSDEYASNGGARNDFEGGYIYWTASSGAVIVRNVAPTVGTPSWSTTPRANQLFSGTIPGTGFIVNGTEVFFCVNGSNTCLPHPKAGIVVNSSTKLSINNVNLDSGSWQVYVRTSAGSSLRSPAFTVQVPPPPTVGTPSWNSTPRANQLFSGTIPGTGFIVNGTEVFFCVNGSSSCYPHPKAGIVVNSATKLSINNVNLGTGSWQVYVRTSTGTSLRSPAFTVQAPPPPPPTVGTPSWNTTPRANQLFSGTIPGTNFVAGNTQVYFCLGGTNSCYPHSSAGVTVNSSTKLSVSNVSLASGAWQVYVKTPAGQSALSPLFAVLLGPPTISSFSWNSTPTGNQAFSGTISGANFVSGDTQVFFCITGSSTCYPHSNSGVTVSNISRLTVNNVRLSKGSWQVYLKTSAGQSARSSAFTVR